MNFLSHVKNYRIERILQMTAHPAYILLGLFFFYGYQRPFYYYPLLMLVCFIAYVVTMKIANEAFDAESLISLTPIITAGNLMLNMEAYDFKSYAIAGVIGITARSFLKTKQGHIFNPGAFGLFVFAMLFPQYGYSSIGLWRSDMIFLVVIFLMGHFVVYKAKRLSLVYGYALGFSVLAIFSSILVKVMGLSYNGLSEVPVLFWPSTLVTATSFVFIFHVISDPKTSPSGIKGQVIFGALIGIIDYFLRISLIIPAEILAYMIVQAAYSVWKVHTRKLPLDA